MPRPYDGEWNMGVMCAEEMRSSLCAGKRGSLLLRHNEFIVDGDGWCETAVVGRRHGAMV